MERKELLKSQQELIRLKMGQANAAQAEMQATVNLIATELGIDLNEKWNLTEDGAAFVKSDPPEKK
jgi:hypothetical protein